MQPCFKLWLEHQGASFGEGLEEMLELIDNCGSLNKAAGSMHMSYRQAWGRIRKVERLLGIKLVDSQVGGEQGGGSALTSGGRDLLVRYRSFHLEVEEAIKTAFGRHFNQ